MTAAAIGLRAKTGRAIAVALRLDRATPLFVWRSELSLVDPAIPATFEPYHEVMELPWTAAEVQVMPLVHAIERVAEDALRAAVEEIRARKLTVRGVGVVGSPSRALEKIHNEHIRAHAAEGTLFRRVLERAAAAHRLPCCAFTEKDIDPNAPELERLAAAAGKPWRTDERLAAAAAWSALTRSG